MIYKSKQRHFSVCAGIRSARPGSDVMCLACKVAPRFGPLSQCVPHSLSTPYHTKNVSHANQCVFDSRELVGLWVFYACLERKMYNTARRATSFIINKCNWTSLIRIFVSRASKIRLVCCEWNNVWAVTESSIVWNKTVSTFSHPVPLWDVRSWWTFSKQVNV